MKVSTMFWCALMSIACWTGSPATLQAQPRIQKTAWQKDAGLGLRWAQITGRFIFQRACLECHDAGAATYSRGAWAEKLAGFPSAEHPELPRFYRDLTAKFAYGRLVPNNDNRLAALQAFLAKNAPLERPALAGLGTKLDLFPAIGSKAPEFKLKDVAGVELSLQKFRGKRNLVLIFSRADW